MQKTDVDRLSVRDLRFLATVIGGGSISRAGDEFGLSQPASSRLMEKLRKTFADPILVRSRSGWTATSAAIDMHVRIQKTLHQIDEMASPIAASPWLSRRRFRVATTDYGALVALGPLVRAVSIKAPDVGFDVEAFSSSTLIRLERGDLDFAFYADDGLPGDFHYRDLFVDRYVVVMSRDHPLAQ